MNHRVLVEQQNIPSYGTVRFMSILQYRRNKQRNLYSVFLFKGTKVLLSLTHLPLTEIKDNILFIS